MRNGLNIPLETNTTRQHSWRVVWLIVLTLAMTAVAWAAFRLATTIDTVSNLRPTETAATVHVRASKRTNTAISTHLGGSQAFPNEPFTLASILAHSRTQYSLHFDRSWQLIGITLDKPIGEDLANTLNARDITTFSYNRRTLITQKVDIAESSAWFVDVKSIQPNYIGRVTYPSDEESTSNRLSLHLHGLVIHQDNHIVQSATPPNIPEEAELLARMSVNMTDTTPATATQLLTNIGADGFFNLFTRGTVNLSIFADAQGTGFALAFENAEASLDLLTTLANELISVESLSTTALTLPDGTTVQELRAQRGSIQSNITTDENGTSIYLENNNGYLVHVQKSANGRITVANRYLATATQAPSSQTTCLRNASTFLKPAAITALSIEPRPGSLTQGSNLVSGLFPEIAFTQKRVGLCW